jgi:hypothetical protein
VPPRKESSGVEEELRDLVWILVMVGSLVLVPPSKEGLGIGGSLLERFFTNNHPPS